MNWFTKNFVSNKSLEFKKASLDEWGGCEHVEEDPSKVHVITYENDTWGREGYCVCEDCYNKVVEEEQQVKYCCHDCKNMFTLESGGVLWKWYDFYPQQGDQPLPICSDCRQKPKHIERVRKDIQDYDEEMDRYNSYRH